MRLINMVMTRTHLTVIALIIPCIIMLAIIKKSHDQPKMVQIGALTQIYSNSTFNHTNPVSIRMIIFRQTRESMADWDAGLAKEAIDAAHAKGLDIKLIGNHYVSSLGELKQILTQDVRKEAKMGDTLMVHTIGHGFPSGGLQALGERSGVVKVLAEVATANKQEMLWWQLSCYAQSGLPRIDTLPADQQPLFSIMSSSDANTVSAAGVQGKIMQRVFVAMAEQSAAIDPNKDGMITASELGNFLNTGSSRLGDLLFAKNDSEPIFGSTIIRIPIIDRRDRGRKFKDDYIPWPTWRSSNNLNRSNISISWDDSN